MNIILCGYHCSGKTTIAKAFAKKYQYQFIDTDHLISEEMCVSESREAHSLLGEDDFRALEKNIVHSIKDIENTIIATGGGVLVNSDSTKHLRTLGKIIYLYLDPQLMLARIIAKKSFPNFIRESHIDEDFKRYIDSRKTLYALQADITFNTTGKTVDEIVLLINQYRSDYGI